MLYRLIVLREAIIKMFYRSFQHLFFQLLFWLTLLFLLCYKKWIIIKKIQYFHLWKPCDSKWHKSFHYSLHFCLLMKKFRSFRSTYYNFQTFHLFPLWQLPLRASIRLTLIIWWVKYMLTISSNASANVSLWTLVVYACDH